MVLKRVALAFGLSLALLLSGCTLKYGDSLLAAPRLPEAYNMLQKSLDELTAGGQAFLVSALTGNDRQAVQLRDLDGDGEDEAIAFIRGTDGVVQVHVFARVAEGFEQVGALAGPGGFRYVKYPRCGKQGQSAIAVSWGQESTVGSGMTLYGLGEAGLYVMLDIQCTQMHVYDMDNDGVDELIFVRRASAEATNEQYFTLSFYRLRDGYYKEVASAELCKEVVAVNNFTFNRGIGSTLTLYVDSQAVGTSGYMTDILYFDGAYAVNRTIDPISGEGSLWRSISERTKDINGDGLYDIPTSDRFERDESIAARETRSNKLIWKNMGGDGQLADTAVTYCNVENKWYILWPEKWGDRILAEYSTGLNRQMIRFYLPVPGTADGGGDERLYLLTLYAFTGDVREQEAQMYSGMEILKRTSTHIYGFSLHSDAPDDLAMTADEVRAMFRTTDINWRTEAY